jgi:GTP-binding protein
MNHPTLTSPSAAAAAGMPTVAIVGRPNVGKSTLFNRMVGSRRAIVGDEPGITRDRLYGEAEWRGRHLRIVDTGGILPEDKDFIPAEISARPRLLSRSRRGHHGGGWRTEMASPDIELARQLIRSGKPLSSRSTKLIPKSNKPGRRISSSRIRKLFPVSAETLVVDDLLDATEILPSNLN